MKIAVAALIAGILLFPGLAARAGNDLTSHQTWALAYAAVVGTSYYADPVPADYDFALTLASVLTQESSLCHHKRGIDSRAYGCGQLQRPTAHFVYGEPISIHKLQHDDALNIRLAARYLVYCMQQMSSWERSVICYNKGPYRASHMPVAAVAADPYLHAIRRRMGEAQLLMASDD
ncbi:MAG: hypothetical protein KGJ56_08435 [Gammaproteobacteria bacterium]|nr:hypothetical protein [Gammaproteobacteria bacterium]